MPSAGSHTGKCVITSNNEKKKQTERAVETDCFNYPGYNTLPNLQTKSPMRTGCLCKGECHNYSKTRSDLGNDT